MSRIVITGLGLQTPLGDQLDQVWNAICTKQTALRHWEDLEEAGFRYHRAARISSLKTPPLQRGRTLALRAVANALQQADADPTAACTGIYLGSTMGESAAFEASAAGQTLNTADYNCHAFAKAIQQQWKTQGPVLAFGTACAAGNYAIGAAADALRNGQIDLAIAGGVDPFSRIAMAGFSRARAMSSKGACRPYDAQRSGMMLGEGAGFLILEREDDARARGATILAAVGVLGLSSDAYHPTAPHPEGEGIARALAAALQASDLGPEEVSWVCGHGSGTRPSDLAESRAIATIFGEGQRISGFKGAFGHTLGAASAIEAILCVQALREGILPPSPGLETPDTVLPVDALTQAISHTAEWVVNCAYAFGGLNSALPLQRA